MPSLAPLQEISVDNRFEDPSASSPFAEIIEPELYGRPFPVSAGGTEKGEGSEVSILSPELPVDRSNELEKNLEADSPSPKMQMLFPNGFFAELEKSAQVKQTSLGNLSQSPSSIAVVGESLENNLVAA